MTEPSGKRHIVRVRGEGRVEVAADGFADAEHLVEKELRSAWRSGSVEILEVSRPGGTSRIVDHFSVSYRLAAEIEVIGVSSAAAPREALRKARAMLSDTRYRRAEWLLPDLPPPA